MRVLKGSKLFSHSLLPLRIPDNLMFVKDMMTVDGCMIALKMGRKIRGSKISKVLHSLVLANGITILR